MMTFLRAFALTLIAVLLAILALWGTLALWFQAPFGDIFRAVLAAGFGLIGAAAVIAQFTRARLRALGLFVVALLCVMAWWRTLLPPSDGDWSPDVAQQVTGQYEGDMLTLTGVRNFVWRTPEDFTPDWDTRSYDTSTLNSTDLIMSFWDDSGIGHMLVSFGFESGQHLAWSVEVRREVGSTFSPIADMFKSHTLVLIAADERDVVGTRTNARGEDVQLYRLNTTPDTGRKLLAHFVDQSNDLAARPQWYNSVLTNCTTVVFGMVRQMTNTIPLDWRVFVNGHLAEYVYEQGFLDSRLSIEELEEKSRITDIARQNGLTPDYSAIIRQNVPNPLR